MADLVAKAHALHAQGLHVFPADHPDQPDCIGAHVKVPCDGIRGKHPAVAFGTWATTVTTQQIDRAWTKHNGLANIAVACGPSNLVILDEDQADELACWCTAYGITLPATYEVSTGRGRHLVYYWDHSNQPIGNGSKAFDGYKIDVRGKGGYAIAEGSRHASGADYIGNGKPIVPLPQNVADPIIAGQSQPQQAAGTSQPAAGTGNPNTKMIPQGERHTALIRYAGRLLKNRNDFAEAEILFRARWELCEQPDGEIPEAKYHTTTCTYAFTWTEARDKLVDAYNRWPLGPKPKKAKKAKAAAPKPQAASTTTSSAGGLYDLADAHIGEYIADTYLKARFLITKELGWMEYDGKRWTSIAEPVIGEAVRLGVLDMYAAEVQAGATTERLKAISSLFSASRIFAIVRIAKGYLWARTAEFDAHPDLLNVNNGVVDLRDGSLGKHDPALLFTKLCPTNYVPNATHADWAKALAALPDDEVRIWLQVRFGQSITGYPTPDDVLVFLEGDGENGKTTMVIAIQRSVGLDYAVTLPDRVLLANNTDHPTELMTLRGARLSFMEELPDQHLNIKRLKDTHGKGSLSARYCGKDSVEWEPTHSIFVTTNHRPSIDEPEHAVWRRLAMVVFPFRYRKSHEPIEDAAVDRRGDAGLRERLRLGRQGRREAVLAWLIEGAVKWYQNSQQMPEPPAAVEAAKEAWRTDADVLLRFARDELVPAGIGPTAENNVMATELYQHFAEWLKARGYREWSDRLFAARFEQHARIKRKGVTKKRLHASTHAATLSRRPTWATPYGSSYANGPVPDKYSAWLGMRFRLQADSFDPYGKNGW